ncbi:MotE family protein [Jeotgalibacillus sp. JSM ZJ347]|uniref:MotE family protein n=1 Tax=Jeotgalibacillus sp. JSM ZJ347 TaxID=3342117 RepID=UPI0035A8C936
MKQKQQKQSIRSEVEETKSPGKLQVFFMLIFVPLLFLIFISLIVLSILDFNIVEKAEEAGISIPFISGDEEVLEAPENPEKRIVSLQAQIEEKDVYITQLEQEMVSLEDENDLLIEGQEKLQAEIERLQAEREAAGREFAEVVSVYEDMKGKEAAPIIMDLNDEDAIRILSSLSAEMVAEIFSAMPSAEAARYTELISSRTQ